MFSLKPFLLGLYGIKGGEAGSLEALAMYAATTKMQYLMLSYFLLGFMEITTGVLRGLGKSLTSTFITLIGACLLRVLWVIFIFPLKENLEIVFVSYPISWFLTSFVAFIIIQIVVRKLVKKRKEELAE